MTSRVLLFGSSGFIGAHVRAALEADPDVTELISPGRDRYDLVDGDRAGLIALLREITPDAVICCVGRLGGTNEELTRANTLVAAKLLDAVEAAAPDARLVRLGSAGEYGVVPHGHAVTETDPTEPISAYGLSHLAGTRLFALAAAAGRVDAVSVRVFNPIGPGQSGENVLGRAQLRLREAAQLGSSEIVLGPLGAYRDFVDVRDLAAVLRSVVLASALPSRIYNAGSGQAVTVRSAVQLLAEQAGFTGEIREHGSGAQRSAAVDWIRADIGRAEDELGWVPAVDLATSIKDIWSTGTPV
ncbi:NAD-dependent epimerase/dehydratase family protein [Actinoplanes awajinensis]|uniref:NarL family transcriptional regulator n=1 Tax=Actinoplanes awajinensis subsp. mycoplanecinus TaxID=135947 RepID=A0A101JJ33_9ACTN|nr:NAD(P)-dependent oxidoreductase [Actinoplanes awajinensis]KUL27796.1 NarL family transcriptional regulator [Actinoplanes awajinensis subsp. mycoplanecinus]